LLAIVLLVLVVVGELVLYKKGFFYMPKKVTPESMRNLTQYRNLPEDKFEEVIAEKIMGRESDAAWEKRIELKLKEFEKDYDLGDLKFNDLLTLRAFVAAVLRLEDLDQIIRKELEKGIDSANNQTIKDISAMQSSLRGDISKMQNDLDITRKSRKSDTESSVLDFIASLKIKAHKFIEQKHMYVFCPKCNTLLFTGWFLYPDYKTNVISLRCHRTLEGGKMCDGEFRVNSQDLLNSGGRNYNEIPDSIK
jgi:hypothetical protein